MDIAALWDKESLAGSSRADFEQVIVELVARLNTALDCDFSIDGEIENTHPHGFRVWIRSSYPVAGILGVTIRGVLFGTETEEQTGLYVGGTLFVYAGGKRLFRQNGESFIDIELARSTAGIVWNVIGWQHDAYAEYDEFDEA